MLVPNGTIYMCGDHPDDNGAMQPGPLTRLMQHTDIPVRYALPIARFARKMSEEIALIGGQRNALILKYGTEKEDEPGRLSVREGDVNHPQFVAEHIELMEMETELDVAKIQIPDNVTIPMSDLIALDSFVEVVGV